MNVTHALSPAAALRRLGRSALLAVLLASAANAQSLTFGQLTGVVVDGARRPVPGAEVRVEDRASGAVRFAVTERSGTFRFVSLPAGRYHVRVEALGYRPVVLLDVDVGAGTDARLDVVTRQASPPVTTVDTVPRQGDAAGASDWLFARGFAELVGPRRLASEVAGLSTTSDRNAVEGLPWRFAEAMVEGSRLEFPGSPGGVGTDGAGLGLPTRSLSAASVGGLGFDVEVGGPGIGILGTSRRGGRLPQTRATVEGGTANIGAAVSGSGPIQGDTAQINAGVDYQRSDISPLDAVDGDARIDERVSAFGRLDWQPGDRIAITTRASGSRYTSQGPAERSGLAAAFGNEFEAFSMQAAVNVHARVSRRVVTEWRVSSEVGDAAGLGGAVPRTAFATTGLDQGSAVGAPFEDQRATTRVSGLLHLDLGAHRLKGGFAASYDQNDVRYVRDSDGRFAFGDYVQGSPLNQRGAWSGSVIDSYAGAFRTSELAFLIQDSWRLAEGLTLSLGARAERSQLPLGQIERNASWLAATGLDNRAVSQPGSRLAPRVGLRWELGSQREWVIEGGGGVFHDLPDRRDLAEALTLDRGADVRRGVGDMSSWPLAPSAANAPVVGRTLSMLGPDFEGPRTQRFALGVTRRLGAWSASLSGVYRHTDFLARRSDLNLPASAPGEDQHGRPLFGSLQQVGTLVTAVPGSNRRFAGFDAVHAIEATGFSDFWGATVGVERVQDDGLSVGLQYTYSSTTDNVLGFGNAVLSPFPNGLNGQDWAEGRSDFDVPHRVLVAADWAASGAVRLGVVYRLSSGAPFTPGVRGGVDANADGDWRNDPAAIDTTLAGLSDLFGKWSCLKDDIGSFATRNACRGGIVHRLDVRAALRLGSLGVGKVELLLEGLNVLAPISGPVDRALLLVDPTGTTTTDSGTGVTTVPYIVNPNFGKVLSDRSPGVLWRVGVRISP